MSALFQTHQRIIDRHGFETIGTVVDSRKWRHGGYLVLYKQDGEDRWLVESHEAEFELYYDQPQPIIDNS